MSAEPVRPPLRLFTEPEIRVAVDDAAALESAERAFTALARGEARVPPPLGLDLEGTGGEIHVKGAWFAGAPTFAFKAATGFYRNVELGLPTGSGVVLVFDARTGFPLAVLADNGYLTDLRTAAAGALAVRELAPRRPLVTAVIGAGVQARLQLRLVRRVREVAELRVWSPRAPSREAYAREVGSSAGIAVRASRSVAEAVDGADLVLTVTPSREPLVYAHMLRSDATVVAVGSDGPDKRELEARLLGGPTKVVTDRTAQCARLGELHHALEAGVLRLEDVHAELGQVVIGERAGREADETIVCDLTGVGVQDAAVADVAFRALAGSGR